jgi:short-subunit dehydrogenase
MSNLRPNQVAAVTGASSGIGLSLAKALAKAGCRVGLIARRREKLDELTEVIRSAGGIAAAAPADVADPLEMKAAIQEIRARLGPIDLLIANAGVGAPTLLQPVNVADIEKMFRINVLGVVYSVAAVLPEMLERRQGHLVGISSLAAYKGLPGESAYCASKAALNVYLEGLRIQLRDRGIRVTTICPGFVKTPMTAMNKFPMPGLMTADAAAERIVRTIRQGRKVYNFPWQAILLTTMSRWMPDWLLARAMHGYNEDPPMPAAPVT